MLSLALIFGGFGILLACLFAEIHLTEKRNFCPVCKIGLMIFDGWAILYKQKIYRCTNCEHYEYR